MRPALLLIADAVINLGLGLLLLVFPRGIVRTLGMPEPASAFYPSLLGGVLIGIGVALIIERFRARGLGLGGAVVINLVGASVLALWLLGGRLALPFRGRILLWGLVALLAALSVFELLILRAQESSRPPTKDT